LNGKPNITMDWEQVTITDIAITRKIMVKTLKVVWRIKNSLFDELVRPKKDSSFCIKELFPIIWEAMWKEKRVFLQTEENFQNKGNETGKKNQNFVNNFVRYIYIYIEREREREREGERESISYRVRQKFLFGAQHLFKKQRESPFAFGSFEIWYLRPNSI